MVFRRRPRARRPRRVNPFKKISTALRVGRKAIGGIKRLHRSLNPQANVCDVVENIDVGEVYSNKCYTNIITLDNCGRAKAMAPYFQEYKATKVELEFIPYQDVFGNTSGVTSSIGNSAPQLLYSHQPAGVLDPAVQNYQSMLEMGCKPIKWTRDLTRSYSPTVVELVSYNNDAFSNGSSANVSNGLRVLKCPWLTTKAFPLQVGGNIPITPLYGAAYFMYQRVGSGETVAIGRVTCKVHFCFRKPLNTTIDGTNPSNPQRAP